nr:MAG TPA: hypothetical protein [Bacteriophage sp.]
MLFKNPQQPFTHLTICCCGVLPLILSNKKSCG